MGISDIDKLAALLPTYPFAVRSAMFGVLALWTIAYAGLVFFAPPAPPPRLALVRFAAMGEPSSPGGLTFEFGLENNTGKVALVAEAFLQFFEKELPDGGLSSKQDVTAVYRIVSLGNGLSVDDGSEYREQATITSPYAGLPYQELTIPLSQTIADKGTDRFRLVLPDAGIIDPRNDHAKVTLKYGSGTAEGTVALPARP